MALAFRQNMQPEIGTSVPVSQTRMATLNLRSVPAISFSARGFFTPIPPQPTTHSP